MLCNYVHSLHTPSPYMYCVFNTKQNKSKTSAKYKEGKGRSFTLGLVFHRLTLVLCNVYILLSFATSQTKHFITPSANIFLLIIRRNNAKIHRMCVK